MNNKMEKTIMEAIRKSLPAEAGNFLQERLAQADFLEQRVKELGDVISKREQTIKELEELLNAYRKKESDYNAMIKREEVLEQNESDLETRKNAFEVKELRYKLEEAEKRADTVTDIVKMVFHSPVYTESIIRNSSSNKYAPDGTTNENENESVVVTKTKQ
jgi:predicted nuclease with TOPRIM domain